MYCFLLDLFSDLIFRLTELDQNINFKIKYVLLSLRFIFRLIFDLTECSKLGQIYAREYIAKFNYR